MKILEIIVLLKKEEKEIVEKKLQEAIDEVNKIVKLNVPLGISVDFGTRYSDIH